MKIIDAIKSNEIMYVGCGNKRLRWDKISETFLVYEKGFKKIFIETDNEEEAVKILQEG